MTDTVFVTVFRSFTVFDAFSSLQLSPSLIRVLLWSRGGSEESKSGRPWTLQRGRSLSQLPGDRDIPTTICLPSLALHSGGLKHLKRLRNSTKNIEIILYIVRLYLCHQPSGCYCWRNYICAFCMFFPKHEKLCVCVSFILLASHNGGKLWALRAYLLQVTWLHHRIFTGLLT